MALNQITRSDSDALIPVEYAKEIFEGVSQESIALNLMTRLADMTAKQLRIPVLTSLPIAYWQTTSAGVGSDTEMKKTSKMQWEGKYVTAEEIAVIIPIPEAVLDDENYDLWGSVKGKVIEAFKAKIDSAVFFGSGTNKPASFPNGIVVDAISNGKTHTRTSSDKFYNLVDDAMFQVEDSGYDVTGIVGGASLRHMFRGLLDANGQPLLAYTDVASLPRHTMKNGAWDKTVADFVVGDFKQAVYSIRQDVSFKVLTEATIEDPTTNTHINLAQQDMVALRVTMRIGWQLPNPVNALDGTSTRYPFAVVEPIAD